MVADRRWVGARVQGSPGKPVSHRLEGRQSLARWIAVAPTGADEPRWTAVAVSAGVPTFRAAAFVWRAYLKGRAAPPRRATRSTFDRAAAGAPTRKWAAWSAADALALLADLVRGAPVTARATVIEISLDIDAVQKTPHLRIDAFRLACTLNASAPLIADIQARAAVLGIRGQICTTPKATLDVA